MTLAKNYLSPFSNSTPVLPLDTLANAATFSLNKWTPGFRLSQGYRLLTQLLTKMYWDKRHNIFAGSNPFHASVRASHAALGASLDLSREWICTLSGRLKAEKWIEAHAPRRPGSNHQEITTYRPGKRLKRLLIQLRESRKPRVNTDSQKVPNVFTKAQIEKGKALFAGLVATVAKHRAMKT